MGLDMYLSKKTYVGNQFRKEMKQPMVQIIVPENFERNIKINADRVSEIVEQVGYWRKVNAIHVWFVKNVQNGVDDCGDYYVESSKLEELLKIVNSVLENHDLADDLLPTQSGFFFGGTDYDEWYFKGLENTKEILETVIAENKESPCDFYYHSSW